MIEPINRINQQLRHLQQRLRRQVFVQALCWASPLAILLPLMLTILGQPKLLAVFAAVLVWVLAGLWVPFSRQYKRINSENLLLQLNRLFAVCQESAHLVVKAPNEMTLLQRMQRQKVLPVVQGLLHRDLVSHFARPALKLPIVLTLLVLIVGVIWQQQWLSLSVDQTSQSTKPIPVPKVVKIQQQQVTVSPPAYSKLAKQQSDGLNIQLLAGAQVTWQIQLNQKVDLPLTLHINQNPAVPFTQQADGGYTLSQAIHQAGVYLLKLGGQALTDVNILEVQADKPPTIAFISPIKTITELPKNGQAVLSTQVEISDDFAITQVQIQASIASGSGEAVKFRDQIFSFDKSESHQGKTLYTKTWQLQDLAMGPGDELYFRVIATDNRSPKPQQTRSPNKIVRWLDDEQSAVLVDGIVIDFMPEYFKSQRQIIIETEQLLKDKTRLSEAEFNLTSRQLAQAQSDLKQKYGQFLGDEFESGALQNMEQGLAAEQDHTHADEAEHKDEHDNAKQAPKHHEAGHAHQQDSMTDTSDKSGYQQIIDQFGHAHGEADDGNFIKKGLPSPKLLMKRAIGNMWQAELFLNLSQPEQALPYENQALALLNRAKKAERVYVKRLGFEPPPVSEKRRYLGDLSDIKSYQQHIQTPTSADDSQALEALLVCLNQAAKLPPAAKFNQDLRQLINNVQAYFNQRLDKHPGDIQYLASLEKMLLAKQLWLTDCVTCSHKLQKKLWQLLDAPTAVPIKPAPDYLPSNITINAYAAFLTEQNLGAQP